RWNRSRGFNSSVTSGSGRRMIFRPGRSYHGGARLGMSTRRTRMLRRLHVLGMCRAACRVSTRLSSRLFFSTAHDTRKRKAAKQNRKCSYVFELCCFCFPDGKDKMAAPDLRNSIDLKRTTDETDVLRNDEIRVSNVEYLCGVSAKRHGVIRVSS